MKKSSRYLFDKRYCYSIRRLAVGVASVAIGCSILGGHTALAEGQSGAGSAESASGVTTTHVEEVVIEEDEQGEVGNLLSLGKFENAFNNLDPNQNGEGEETPENPVEKPAETVAQPPVSVEVEAHRITVRGDDSVYQPGIGLANIKDGFLNTLTELKWDITEDKVTLPQTIDFQFDQATTLDKMEIHKRTPGNGTLTKYKVEAFSGEEKVYASEEVDVDFTLEKVEHSFEPEKLQKTVDKVSLTLLEARTSADTVNQRMLTLRDVTFYELSKVLSGRKISNDRLTVSGDEQKYEQGQEIDYLIDGNKQTLAELRYDDDVKLPEDITISLDQPTNLTGFALHKRFESNGSLTKYKARTYLGDHMVESTEDIDVPFDTTLSVRKLNGQAVDRLVLTILEAKTRYREMAPHQLTLREIELFEAIPVEEEVEIEEEPDTGNQGSNSTTPESPEQPSAPDTGTSSPEQPSAPDTGTSSPEQPSTPDTGTSSPEQPSAPDTGTSSPEQPSAPDTGTSSPEQPVAPEAAPAMQLPPVEVVENFTRPTGALGAITSFTFNDGVASIRYATGEQAQVSLYNDHVFRYYVDKTGEFRKHPEPSDPNRPANIVIKELEAYKNQYATKGRLITEDSRYVIETDKVWLIFDKETARLSIFDRLNNRFVTKEVVPVEIGTDSASQTLSQDKNEYFFGGGMQNGRFTHKGNKINIVNENNWVDGGVASPSPFYWSTKGYGVLRHTFKRGAYDFGSENKEQIETRHLENRFDAFYFINSKPSDIIKDYQELTGKPAVLPEYALYLGHLNAYNRDFWVEVPEGTRGAILLDGKWYKEYQPQHLPGDQRDKAVKETLNGEGNSYTFSARAVIDRYKAYDMPLSWFLPNDGYGAGYGQTNSLDGNIANLKAFVEYAKSKGIKVGLWTQSDLVDTNPSKDVVLHRHIDKEVADAGIRAIKTDVAWVGPGYSFGLNGVDEGAKRLTEQSGAEAARPFIISLDGWGGTQRSAAIWSGDQSGGEWEYIRFHIPTYIGLGLSGNPNMGSDMDGIFGGADPIINARDYQWKMFTSILMNMDGWGSKPKNPFAFDDRTTDINRMSLKQKSTLVPYAYSIGHEASVTGKPIVRAMFIDFPEEAVNYTKDVQYQYMYGSNILVAPIYQNTAMEANGDDVRNGIFLPGDKEEWIDWYTGTKYKGAQVLNGFKAPLWKAPVFIRNGAIIPMTAANNNPDEIDRTKRLIQFYPHGTSSFTLYEDDGTSVEYKSGQLATTLIESKAENSNIKGQAVLTIHASQGEFKGFQKNKTTELHVNVSEDVDVVQATIGSRQIELRRVSSLEEYENGQNVYFYHDNPLLDTYNPRSQDIKNLRVVRNDLLKIKLEATDVTQSEIKVTISGFINKNEMPTIPSEMTVPAVPNGLTAPENKISSTSIGVEWQVVEGASTYDVERDGLVYTGIVTNQFNFENFDFGSTHTFRVRAVNAKGVSDWSGAITVKTSEDPWADAIEGIQARTNISAQGGQELENLFDKKLGGQFHSTWGEAVNFPATIQMDLGGIYSLDRIEYYPRNDNGANGRITKAYFEVSEDGVNWTVDQYYSHWANDNKPKVYRVTEPRTRYIRMNIEAGVGDFVSGEEILVFKKPGSRMLIPGDISNDGRISEDDKTSFLNYSGLRRQDNDFAYISHADSNKNGLIDAYDISLAAVQLEGGVQTPSTVSPTGDLYLTADKLELAQGEETTIRLMASDLAAVNALTSTFTIKGTDFEVVDRVQGKAAFTKQAENFSSVRARGEDTNIVFSFVNFGQKELLAGSGEVATLRIRATRALTLSGSSQEGILVGNGLRVQLVENKAIRQSVTYTATPAIPSQVEASRLTSASASLIWLQDKQALRYSIEQEKDGQFVEIGRSETAHFDVHNLLPNQSYRLRIKALNPLGESDYSTVVEVMTPAKDLTRKVAITNATASVEEQVGEELAKFIDGDEESLYHSDWDNTAAVPSELVLDLGEEKAVDHLLYLPRTNAGNGTIKALSLSISNDGQNWQDVGDVIRWAVNNHEKTALLPKGTQTRYIKINWLDSVGGFVSGNELTVMGPAATSETPSTPNQPEQPSTPNQPEQPSTPNQPEQPSTPNQPEQPSTPSQPTYDTPHVLYDSMTGIRVQLEKGEHKKIVGLKVIHKETGHEATPAVLGSTDYDLYDIVLVDDKGQAVENTQDVLVLLPIDDGKEVAKVVYLPNSEQAEELVFTETVVPVGEGKEQKVVSFMAKHFSEYGIIYKGITAKGNGVVTEDLPEFNGRLEKEHQPTPKKPNTSPLGHQPVPQDKPTSSIDSEKASISMMTSAKGQQLPNTGVESSFALTVLGFISLAATAKIARRKK